MNDILQIISNTLEQRKAVDSEKSYVASLYQKGLNKILEKVGEEATEVILAARDAEVSGEKNELVHEVADLWFHTMVTLSYLNVDFNDVLAELAKRHK